MLKKLLLILLTTIAVVGALRAVDLNSVEVEINMNPAGYRQLLDRFNAADTTLTPEQLATVYYGYAFTPGYNPTESHQDVIRAYEQADYDTALELATDALRTNPVSLDLSVIALASADRLRDRKNIGRLIARLGLKCDLIATAILGSGQGTSASSPFIVIDSADIDRVLRNILGIDSIVDRTKVGDILAFKVTFPGNQRRHIIYFDNSPQQRFVRTHPIVESISDPQL